MGQAGRQMHQPHTAGRAVGVLAARPAAGDALLPATGQQVVFGKQDIPDHCGRHPAPVCCVGMIVAHLPDGVCRIRITTEPMFSRSEFVPLVLESMLDVEKRLIIDLGLVTMLHSPSLANLVTLHTTLAKRQCELILTGLHEKNLRILEITKLDRLFSIQQGI